MGVRKEQGTPVKKSNPIAVAGFKKSLPESMGLFFHYGVKFLASAKSYASSTSSQFPAK